MASLRKCKGCGEQVSKKAYSCPHCGEPFRQTAGNQLASCCLGIIVFGLAISAVVFCLGAMGPLLGG